MSEGHQQHQPDALSLLGTIGSQCIKKLAINPAPGSR
jgi:hypothetical protein